MIAGTPPAEITLTAETVCALLADQHPQYAQLPIRAASEGWDNFIFRLGAELAVRLPRRQIAAQLVLNEQRCLPVLAPRLPVLVPVPRAVGSPAHGFPWHWSIVPWIDGSPVDHAPLDARQGLALAAFLRALHQPSPADAPINSARGVRLETRRARLEERLERLRAASDLITPAIERAWRDALAAPFPTTAVWLHGDLHAQNLLSKYGVLSGVIDWGDICGGDPAVDLGSVWGVLGHASAREAALRAYAPDAALLARARGWAILLGATLYDTGRIDNPRHAAIGETTLRRVAEDL